MGKKDSKVNRKRDRDDWMWPLDVNGGYGRVSSSIPDMSLHTDAVERRGIRRVPLPLDGTSSGGIVVGGSPGHVMTDVSERHGIVFGTTGSGKSMGVSIPTILMSGDAGHHMVISDVKEDMYCKTAGFLEARGYEIYRIDMRNPETSYSWNPLLDAYRLYSTGDVMDRDRAKQLLMDMSAVLCPITNWNDPYWELACRNFITGLCLTLFENSFDEAQVNMRSLVKIKAAAMSDDSPFDRYFDHLDKDGSEYLLLCGMYKNAESTKRCIYSMFDKVMSPFMMLDSLSSTTAYSDLDINDIGVRGKIAVFLTVPDETDSRDAVVSLFVSQLAATLTRNAHSFEGKRLPKNVMFVLDEFATFPAMQTIPRLLATSRSRGIRFLLLLQGLGQLRSRYGEDLSEAIMGNCDDILYIHSRELPLLRRISELSGEDAYGKPLMTVGRLQNLDPLTREAVLFAGRGSPIITRFTDFRDFGEMPRASEPDVRGIRDFETLDPWDCLRPENRIGPGGERLFTDIFDL
ncbi:MAG: type IV secretory system conjugative DNA transfer family protein [Candidatus Methanomethylophilaceae archaeon]|nr:type IV secretory system conjugative DNA transfer family protein [Candidatus Methanomethylophilaceae archaeon]